MILSLINKASIAASVERLAKKAASQEAFDGGSATAFTTKEVFERYFQKYGTTQQKFKYHPKPGFYIGYVQVPGTSEFLSVVFVQKGGSVAASFRPDIEHGQDLLGLMGKKAFADEVTDSIIRAAGG